MGTRNPASQGGPCFLPPLRAFACLFCAVVHKNTRPNVTQAAVTRWPG